MSNFVSHQINGFDRAEHERMKAEHDAPLKAARAAELSEAQDNAGQFRGGRFVHIDGEAVFRPAGVQKANASDLRTGAGGVLDTATAAWGTPQAPSAVNADSLVTVNGMTMKASIAERMGILIRDAGGYYREVGSATGPF